MKRLTLLGSILLALGAFFAGGVPVFGDTGGTVPTTVIVPAAVCVTVDTTPISYGTLPFSTATNSVGSGSAGGVTSCSTVNQNLSVAGANATGNLGAAWTITDTGSCPGMGTNKFKHRVSNIDGGSFLTLTTTPALTALLSPGESTGAIPTEFIMPCTGSDGAGQTISTSIIFTATF